MYLLDHPVTFVRNEIFLWIGKGGGGPLHNKGFDFTLYM